MRVLVTGADGQLGQCLRTRMSSDWELLFANKQTLDITNYDEIIRIVDLFKPDFIVNTAAYTAVDKAEQNIELATSINTIGPQYLAEIANQRNIRLIHISTDYVFNGKNQKHYVETDITSPINVYGITKRDGENIILLCNPSAIIIRTSWVFSEFGNNFLKTILRLSCEKTVLRVVNDQVGCPTYAGDVANFIVYLIENNFSISSGIYHYCGSNPLSWYDFAHEILSIYGQVNNTFPLPELIPILTKDYPVLAKRPLNSVLSCKKLNTINMVQPNWQVVLFSLIEKLSKDINHSEGFDE